MTPQSWLTRLDADPNTLAHAYGLPTAQLPDRIRLLRRVIATFQERFGEAPLRLFRAPGRINLRGMHVDTHGGYVNLMTHQREIVIAATPIQDQAIAVTNIDPTFDDVACRTDEAPPAQTSNWNEIIAHPKIMSDVQTRPGHWSNYVKGAALRVLTENPNSTIRGFHAVVGSDLPQGAALSSSAALCIAIIDVLTTLNGVQWTKHQRVTAARDVEWYTGARVGTCDQTAIVHCNQNEILNCPIRETGLDETRTRRTGFPANLSVLVINSYTQRNLSGAQRSDYVKNRFAYSLAIQMCQTQLRNNAIQFLSDITPENLGKENFFNLLRAIPQQASIQQLRTDYNLQNLDDTYDRYFANLPEPERPDRFDIRGPLLYGIAESERARRFPDAIAASGGEAGQLMTTGHNGDRRTNPDGTSFAIDLGDQALERIQRQDTPIEQCPGAYRASSPILDALVDTALSAGALGASLTGAGIAGAVLALCTTETAGAIAKTLRQFMADNPHQDLTDTQRDQAVLINYAPNPAGEIRL